MFRIDDVVEAVDRLESGPIEIGERLRVAAVSVSGHFLRPAGHSQFFRARAFHLVQRPVGAHHRFH